MAKATKPEPSNVPPNLDDTSLPRNEADEVAPPPIVSQETPRPARQGDEGRPFCPDHLCLLRATGTRESVTNYACPVPNCDCKEKRARPQINIPAQPTQCPSRICDHPPQFLRIVPAKSNLAYAHMECPRCKFSVKQPRPQYSPTAENARRRAALDEFAGR